MATLLPYCSTLTLTLTLGTDTPLKLKLFCSALQVLRGSGVGSGPLDRHRRVARLEHLWLQLL